MALFELQFQRRQPLFLASSLVFFSLGLALASSDVGTAVGDAPGTSLRNAPIVVVRLMPVVSLLALFAITAFVASAALRDFERHSEMLFFTKPIRKMEYLGGRFVGAMVASMLVLLAAVLGLVFGGFMPWQPPDRLGPFDLGPYVFGLLVIVLPNLLIMGAMFFALAIWSRRLTVTYLCVVFFIGMQDAVEVVAQNLESRVLGSLIEPSGLVALETMTRYWTIAEQNVRVPGLDGVLLANRALWMGLALAALWLSFARFGFFGGQTTAKARVRRALEAPASRRRTAVDVANLAPLTLPSAGHEVAGAHHWRQLGRQARLEVSEVLGRAPFLTLMAIGLMFVGAFSYVAGANDGMASYPLTPLMLEGIRLGVRMTLVMILVLYAGELIFSQRSLQISHLYDALPVANWVYFGAKLLALLVVAGVFLVAAAGTTVAVQLVKGFGHIEPSLYARGLAVIGLPLVPLIILAAFIQVLVNRKVVGILLTTLVLVLRFALPRLGFEDNLVLFGSHPTVTYSAFNGYGHHVGPFLWFMAYWGSASLILLAATLLLWPRGIRSSLRARLGSARLRLTKPILGLVGVGLLGMLTAGGWIVYNTRVRNEYRDRDQIIHRLADFEQRYQQYRDAPAAAGDQRLCRSRYLPELAPAHGSRSLPARESGRRAGARATDHHLAALGRGRLACLWWGFAHRRRPTGAPDPGRRCGTRVLCV